MTDVGQQVALVVAGGGVNVIQACATERLASFPAQWVQRAGSLVIIGGVMVLDGDIEF